MGVEYECIQVLLPSLNFSIGFCLCQVLITMHGSDDYEFVTVEELGWSNPYNPNTHKGDHQTIVFVSAMHSWIYGGGWGEGGV